MIIACINEGDMRYFSYPVLAKFISCCILHLVARQQNLYPVVYSWQGLMSSHSSICFYEHRKRNNSSTLWDKGGSSSGRFHVCTIFLVSSKPWKHWSYKTNQPSKHLNQALQFPSWHPYYTPLFSLTWMHYRSSRILRVVKSSKHQAFLIVMSRSKNTWWRATTKRHP